MSHFLYIQQSITNVFWNGEFKVIQVKTQNPKKKRENICSPSFDAKRPEFAKSLQRFGKPSLSLSIDRRRKRVY